MEIRIPKMERRIHTRNSREEIAALVFVNNMEACAEAAIEGYKWALEVVDIAGCASLTATDLGGRAAAFYHMDMLDEPLSSVEIADAIRELYVEMKEAKHEK